MASLDPRWAGGRPRRTHWMTRTSSSRRPRRALRRWGCLSRGGAAKLAAYLGDNQTRVVKISAERLRQILAARGVTFQRTKTWKESNDPERDAKLDRMPWGFPAAVFRLRRVRAADDPPRRRGGWALAGRPPLIAGPRGAQFHGLLDRRGCLWGVVRQRKSAAHTLAALKSIGARHSDGEWIYVILDNLRAAPCASGHETTESSCASPRPTALGPTRPKRTRAAARVRAQQLPDPNHTVLTRRMHAYLRWRNANAPRPRPLAAQRRERARTRAEKGHRWGRPLPQAA